MEFRREYYRHMETADIRRPPRYPLQILAIESGGKLLRSDLNEE